MGTIFLWFGLVWFGLFGLYLDKDGAALHQTRAY